MSDKTPFTKEEEISYIDKLLKYFRNPDPESSARMKYGAELYRKGMLSYQLINSDGTPYNGTAKVCFTQKSHEFEFGCNGFMLKGFQTEEENQAYEKYFKRLFNLMVIPFYWGDLEPEEGKPRYAKDSPYIYRRPSPDLLLEFCEQNGITPKGHVLLYDHHTAKWLKRDTAEHLKRIYERHVREIAERYGDKIYNWDVTNEVTYHTPSQIIPEDFAHFAFKIAEKYFPVSTRFNYNDGNSWRDTYGYYSVDNMLENWLLLDNCKVDAIGLQYHMIGCPDVKNMLPWWGEYYFNPEHINNVLDIWTKVGKPVSISEVTITGREDLGTEFCEEFQRFCTEILYKIWFSHPNTNGIIWWNLVDDTALGVENQAKGGLIHRDMTPKPAYRQLEKMLLNDWNTNCTNDYDSTKKNYVRGYYGTYNITIELPDGKVFHTEEKIVSGRKNEAKIIIPDDCGGKC